MTLILQILSALPSVVKLFLQVISEWKMYRAADEAKQKSEEYKKELQKAADELKEAQSIADKEKALEDLLKPRH